MLSVVVDKYEQFVFFGIKIIKINCTVRCSGAEMPFWVAVPVLRVWVLSG